MESNLVEVNILTQKDLNIQSIPKHNSLWLKILGVSMSSCPAERYEAFVLELLWFGTPCIVRALQRLIRKYNPQYVFLQESRLHKVEMDQIRSRLHFDSMLNVDCQGRGRYGMGVLLYYGKMI